MGQAGPRRRPQPPIAYSQRKEGLGTAFRFLALPVWLLDVFAADEGVLCLVAIAVVVAIAAVEGVAPFRVACVEVICCRRRCARSGRWRCCWRIGAKWSSTTNATPTNVRDLASKCGLPGTPPSPT